MSQAPSQAHRPCAHLRLQLRRLLRQLRILLARCSQLPCSSKRLCLCRSHARLQLPLLLLQLGSRGLLPLQLSSQLRHRLAVPSCRRLQLLPQARLCLCSAR